MFQRYYPDVNGCQFQTDKEMGIVRNDFEDQYPHIKITGLTWQDALKVIKSIPQPRQYLPNPKLPPLRFQRIYFHGNNPPPEAPQSNLQTLEYASDRINIDLDDNNLVTGTAIA